MGGLFGEAMDRIAGRFGRVEPRRTARAFVLGLLSDVDDKSCWQLAEQAGYRRPDAMQRLLRPARWDAEAVRDDVRGLVVQRVRVPTVNGCSWSRGVACTGRAL